jgi:hypothetical protein
VPGRNEHADDAAEAVVNARLSCALGSSHLVAQSSCPVFVNMVGSRGETMGTTLFLECSGAVVVHRDQSVSCTDDTCPRDLPKVMWFNLHSSFVRCSTALGGAGCLYCEFEVPVTVGTRRWQPERS